MNVGQLKNLIGDIPDDYILQIDTIVHPDDIDDLLVECLTVKKVEKDESKKFVIISVGLRTLDVKATSSLPIH